MDCQQFEDSISDYLDCGLARPVRRSFCEHLLACRPCHQTFNDVRTVLDACYVIRESNIGSADAASGIEQRIISAITVGEMLSCRTLDALILEYFEGNIESSYETIFNEHFAVCDDCRRLVEGVRESLEEPEAVEVPVKLYDRIFAATVGLRRIA
ncbi:MAG: zf-HC2 domain-containing protein [Acidobacteria bacterium]|nr:zf-HC2 domain-containing protein [Acidobacteriota bacterium]